MVPCIAATNTLVDVSKKRHLTRRALRYRAGPEVDDLLVLSVDGHLAAFVNATRVGIPSPRCPCRASPSAFQARRCRRCGFEFSIRWNPTRALAPTTYLPIFGGVAGLPFSGRPAALLTARTSRGLHAGHQTVSNSVSPQAEQQPHVEVFETVTFATLPPVLVPATPRLNPAKAMKTTQADS